MIAIPVVAFEFLCFFAAVTVLYLLALAGVYLYDGYKNWRWKQKDYTRLQDQNRELRDDRWERDRKIRKLEEDLSDAHNALGSSQESLDEVLEELEEAQGKVLRYSLAEAAKKPAVTSDAQEIAKAAQEHIKRPTPPVTSTYSGAGITPCSCGIKLTHSQ